MQLKEEHANSVDRQQQAHRNEISTLTSVLSSFKTQQEQTEDALRQAQLRCEELEAMYRTLQTEHARAPAEAQAQCDAVEARCRVEMQTQRDAFTAQIRGT